MHFGQLISRSNIHCTICSHKFMKQCVIQCFSRLFFFFRPFFLIFSGYLLVMLFPPSKKRPVSWLYLLQFKSCMNALSWKNIEMLLLEPLNKYLFCLVLNSNHKKRGVCRWLLLGLKDNALKTSSYSPEAQSLSTSGGNPILSVRTNVKCFRWRCGADSPVWSALAAGTLRGNSLARGLSRFASQPFIPGEVCVKKISLGPLGLPKQREGERRQRGVKDVFVLLPRLLFPG